MNKPGKCFVGIRDRGGVLIGPEDVTLMELRRLKKWIDRTIKWREAKRGEMCRTESRTNYQK